MDRTDGSKLFYPVTGVICGAAVFCRPEKRIMSHGKKYGKWKNGTCTAEAGHLFRGKCGNGTDPVRGNSGACRTELWQCGSFGHAAVLSGIWQLRLSDDDCRIYGNGVYR